MFYQNIKSRKPRPCPAMTRGLESPWRPPCATIPSLPFPGFPLMSRTIAVANQKGGVGKTTTSVNLGAGLALAGRRTLLIDLDPQANSTRALGFERNPERRTIYDALIEGFPIEETLLATDLENLSLCPSENELTGAEVELQG